MCWITPPRPDYDACRLWNISPAWVSPTPPPSLVLIKYAGSGLMLASDWLRLITCPRYWPLIGLDWSYALVTGLWLVLQHMNMRTRKHWTRSSRALLWYSQPPNSTFINCNLEMMGAKWIRWGRNNMGMRGIMIGKYISVPVGQDKAAQATRMNRLEPSWIGR